MTRQTIGTDVNPSDETIRLGPLTIQFLVAAEDSGGSIVAADSSKLRKSRAYGIDSMRTQGTSAGASK